MEADIVPLPPRQDWSTKLGVKAFRYKGLVKRFWWVLLLTVSCGLVWQGWNLFRTPVLYSSDGTLMVTEPIDLPNAAVAREESDDFYGTQLSLLSKPEIAERARQHVAMDAPDLQPCDVGLTPTQEPRTSLFILTGVGTNGAYVQRFVEAVMEETIKFKSEKLSGVSNNAESSYSSELTRLGNERDKQEQDLQNFIKDNDMAEADEQGTTAAKYLADLKTRQANLQTELDRLQTLSAQELLTTTGPSTDEDGNTQTNEYSEQYTALSQQLAEKKAEFAERSLVWKPAHPRLIALKEDITNIEVQLSTIEQENTDASKVRIEAIKTELTVLGKSIDEWTKKALDANEKETEYQGLKGDLDRTSASYDKLLAAINSIDMSKDSPGEVSIMTPASVPEIVNPGTVRHLMTGLVMGLALGIAILAIMDKADDRFSSPTEVMEHFTEPIMGQIPNVEETRTKDGLPLLNDEDERYAFAESFRSLRSSLLFMPNQGAMKSLLVTSSIPSEGKSTIASNLAITMSLAGTRVLLVDADLRRGDLASLFNVDGRFGLSSILRDEMPWRTVAKTTQFGNLTLIPRGPVTNQSSELLLVPRFDTLMKEWKSTFDLVLFNTSPILATDDTATIAPNFDGALMVVRAQFTSARLVRNSLNAMYQRRVNILGLILNSVNTEAPDYYYYRYPKYYAA
ncbi:MAG: polysaccharide biosynthesis tyrosine autokinase [Chthoniobacteraceae bacterium]|jgi:capsular exopolysaccharide synthesis family protein